MPYPNGFDPAEAAELGEVVEDAYNLYFSGNPSSFTPQNGYTLLGKLYADDITDSLPYYTVVGIVAQAPNPPSHVVIALRGTEGVFEWIRDFEFGKVDFPYVPNAGRTEEGFTSFYSTLRTGPNKGAPRAIEVLPELLKDVQMSRLCIAGHSLGAAVATLLALDVSVNTALGTPLTYTFASPLVGDDAFAGVYNNRVPQTWRIENQLDIVPKLPPDLFGFEHVGTQVAINSGAVAKNCIPCWHSLLTYLHLLDATLPLDKDCT